MGRRSANLLFANIMVTGTGQASTIHSKLVSARMLQFPGTSVASPRAPGSSSWTVYLHWGCLNLPSWALRRPQCCQLLEGSWHADTLAIPIYHLWTKLHVLLPRSLFHQTLPSALSLHSRHLAHTGKQWPLWHWAHSDMATFPESVLASLPLDFLMLMKDRLHSCILLMRKLKRARDWLEISHRKSSSWEGEPLLTGLWSCAHSPKHNLEPSGTSFFCSLKGMNSTFWTPEAMGTSASPGPTSTALFRVSKLYPWKRNKYVFVYLSWTLESAYWCVCVGI
jgi:hypothetical protein